MDNVVTEIRAILTMQAEQFKAESDQAAKTATANFQRIAATAIAMSASITQSANTAVQNFNNIASASALMGAAVAQAVQASTSNLGAIGRSAAIMGVGINQGVNLVVSEFKWMASEVSSTVSALVATVETSMNRMFRTAKDAHAFQATIDQMNGLEYAAQRAGGSISQVERITGMLEKSLGAALSSGKAGDKQRGVFAALGLDPESLAHMGGVGALSAIATEVGKIGSASERAQIISILTGGGRGKQLGETIELFHQLKGGIEGVTEEMAHYYGVANSEEAYAKIELAKESTFKLAQVWRGMVDTLTVAVAPAIVNVQKALDNLGVTGQSVGEYVKAMFAGVVEYIRYVITDLQFLYTWFDSTFKLVASIGDFVTKSLIAGWSNVAFAVLKVCDSIEGGFRGAINSALGDINRLITLHDRAALALGMKTIGTIDPMSTKTASGGLAAAAGRDANSANQAAIDAAKEFYNNAKNFSPGTLASNALKTGEDFKRALFSDIGSKERAAQNAKDRGGAMDAHDDHTDTNKHKELGLAGRLGSMQSVWALTQQHSHLDSVQENTKCIKELTNAIKKGSHVGGQRQGAILHS